MSFSNFSDLSDFELYRIAKAILLSEMISQKTDKYKLQLISNECSNRKKNIIELAYYSACYTYENIIDSKNFKIIGTISDNVTESHFYKIVESINNVNGSNILTHYLIGENIIKPENLLIARVNGISMLGYGFEEGNYGIADRSLKPKNGNFVIAEVNQKKFIKKLVIENGNYILRSSSSEFPDYLVKNIKKEILAVVVFQLYGMIEVIE